MRKELNVKKSSRKNKIERKDIIIGMLTVPLHLINNFILCLAIIISLDMKHGLKFGIKILPILPKIIKNIY